MPELENTKMLNRVILIDRKGFDSELKDQQCHFEILSKPMILNDTIFKLIDQNERLPKQQFQFVLEKYLEHVNFVLYVSDWMENHVELDIPNLREDTKNTFISQTKVFLKHVEDLKSHIIIPNKLLKNQEVNVLKFIENNLTEVKSELNIITDSERSNDLLKNVETPKLLKKKSPLITEEDAEAFLLETVFQIGKEI
ncbi:hypothetical protein ACFFU1_18220 [Algibacter miyuki]|uniref:Uncharacterized protein n=1 Tax=Algibacter miyuki TaxID=1306933 RepID=A0ABV5H6D9_9FLAO|nr:hypothetical protein [Algibacter miyuki]MDN3665778.1 hypothetical protein [Algibacter miyuki]